jgi:precorrin-6B methylase 1
VRERWICPWKSTLEFKIDQNLPAECAALLREAGFEADIVDYEGLGGADDSIISERACRSADVKKGCVTCRLV